MVKNILRKGFTLVEVLLVVVIIAILAGIVIVAVNPGRQIAQTNNTERRAHVQSISNAIAQYSTDHRGARPTGIPAATAQTMGSGAGQANFCTDLVPTYLPSIPFDAQGTGAHWTSCADFDSGYTVVDVSGRITVAAPGAELSETISVTR